MRRPGKGVLVRIGPVFHYPARLLQVQEEKGPRHWRIKLWRHCEFTVPSDKLDLAVPKAHIVDELWNNQGARRKIRVRPESNHKIIY